MLKVLDINYVRTTVDNNQHTNIVFGLKVLNTTGDTLSTNAVYFANVEKKDDDISSSLYNTYCLKTSDDKIYHNMYRSYDNFYKSALYKKGTTALRNNTYDFLDIFCSKLSNDLCNIILVENTFYALSPETIYGHYNITEDINSYLSSDTGHTYPPEIKILHAIYDNNLSVKSLLSGINHNMLLEFPGNVYNDYNSGSILANSYKCKNVFDSEYTMKHSEGYKLNNARNYKKLDHCNKQIYLIYNDNKQYSNNGSITISNDGFTFDNIEVLDSVNRYLSNNMKKTNLYSISIKSDVFNIDDEKGAVKKYKEMLKTEVQHIVRNIVEKFTPVNTQLLSVFIN